MAADSPVPYMSISELTRINLINPFFCTPRQLEKKLMSYAHSLPFSSTRVTSMKPRILSAYDQYGNAHAMATRSFADTWDPSLHDFVVAFAGIQGTRRDPNEEGLSPSERKRRMCENLADFPVAVVKYWNYMIDGCIVNQSKRASWASSRSAH